MTEEVKDIEVQDSGEKAGEHGPYTMDELRTAIESDPEIRNAFLKDEEQFYKDHPIKEAEPPTKSKEESKLETKEDELPEEIQVTVKSDWLGTYGKNRKPEDAIHEMSKGNEEKDKTIDFFKKEKLPQLEGELKKLREGETSLKRQLEEYKKRLEKPKEEITIPEVDVIDDFDDDLFLSEDGQAKFKKSYTGLAQAVKGLSQKLSNLEKGPKEPEVKEPEQPEQPDFLQEYSEIDNFVSSKKDFFGQTPPIEMMENEFLDFMGNLAKVSNLQGPIQQANGQFVPELQNTLKTYLEDNEDKSGLRKALSDKELPSLDEGKYKTLTSIYKIRNIKNEYKVPYEVALEIYDARNKPSEDELKLQGNIEGHSRYEKAKANREQYVKETPAQNGGGDAELLKLPVGDFKAIMDKPKDKWSDREWHVVKTVYKQQGIGEDELKKLFKIK